MIIPAKAA